MAGKELVIGTTYKLEWTYRTRLKIVAWRLGYPLKIVDLRFNNLDKNLSEIHGILAPGGADINPEFYINKINPKAREEIESKLHYVKMTDESQERDSFEHNLLTRYSNEDKFRKLPLLGICRGMQMMSVVQGIPLYVDLEAEAGVKNKKNTIESIRVIDQKSVMSNIFGKKKILGFKIHHQGIRLPYYEINREDFPLAKVTSVSNNNKVAESLEYLHRPALGVQYHPERSLSGACFPIMKWFFEKAQEYKSSIHAPIESENLDRKAS